jgi:hypothetical protein
MGHPIYTLSTENSVFFQLVEKVVILVVFVVINGIFVVILAKIVVIIADFVVIKNIF